MRGERPGVGAHVVSRRPDPSDGRPVAITDGGETTRIDGRSLLDLVETARPPIDDEPQIDLIESASQLTVEQRRAHTVPRKLADGSTGIDKSMLPIGAEFSDDADLAIPIEPSIDLAAVLADAPQVEIAEPAPPNQLRALFLGLAIGSGILVLGWLLARL